MPDAVEGGKNLSEEEDKKPVEEEDKNIGEGSETNINPEGKEQVKIQLGEGSATVVKNILASGGVGSFYKVTSASSTLDGQQEQQLGGAQKTDVLADIEEPTVVEKTDEQTNLLTVVEKEAASNKIQLKKKKEKKRKRSELVQIKKEKQFDGAEKKERRDEKNRKRLKRELIKKMMRSPQANLVRSSIGRFARVVSLRNENSPRAQRTKSESPSVPNVTAHFPSPDPPHVEPQSTRGRPWKLKSRIWKDFIPLYVNGKVAEGQCKHCNEVFPASKTHSVLQSCFFMLFWLPVNRP